MPIQETINISHNINLSENTYSDYGIKLFDKLLKEGVERNEAYNLTKSTPDTVCKLIYETLEQYSIHRNIQQLQQQLQQINTVTQEQLNHLYQLLQPVISDTENNSPIQTTKQKGGAIKKRTSKKQSKTKKSSKKENKNVKKSSKKSKKLSKKTSKKSKKTSKKSKKLSKKTE